MFWHDWLYTPLINLLIFLYGTVADGSLGLAVIALTVLIRIALLPLSVLSERAALAFDRMQVSIRRIEAENASDQVLRKERIREFLRAHRVNPWAKVVVLAVQFLVLVLLYQVFVNGINAELGSLYPWVVRPEVINTSFFGFELGEHSLAWAGAVGVFLFIEIAVSLGRRAHVDRSDLYYLFLFPLFVFVVLWYLPMVKSLFILTSMLFSMLLAMIRVMVFKSTPVPSED